MPHSSGGGSSSGGSHGGSSSHSSSGSSGSSVRRSRNPFVGGIRYVYYDRHSAPHYFYSTGEKHSKLRYLILLLYIPFLVMIFSMMSTAFRIPKKLAAETSPIIIDDALNIMDDKTSVMTALQEFQDLTGITPAIMTVNSWSGYSSLESFAYAEYVTRFQDENHWLIVYADLATASDSHDNWYWEGMQGNNTDPVLTVRICDEFNEKFQRELASRNTTFSQDVTTAFSELNQTVMKSEVDFSMFFMSIGVLAFIVVHAMLMSGLNPIEWKYRKAVPAPEYISDSGSNGFDPLGSTDTLAH